MRLSFSLLLISFVCFGRAIDRDPNVIECKRCKCPGMDPSVLEKISYSNGREMTRFLTNDTIFLSTGEWYVTIHDVMPNPETTDACFAATYTSDPSENGIEYSEWVCMDLSTHGYRVGNQSTVPSNQTSASSSDDIIFLSFNSSETHPLGLSCTRCNVSVDSPYNCTVRPSPPLLLFR
jgi:hypothetical protein